MEQLYVLQCEKGKYYVGKTSNVMRRFDEHKTGKGSAWTNKYKPTNLIECKPISSPHDENNTTKDYMKKYGIEHVRGGVYAQIVLPDDMLSALRNELQGVSDLCYKCSLAGHVASKCPITMPQTKLQMKSQAKPQAKPKAKPVEEVVWECNYCDRQFDTEYGCGVHERYCKKKETNVKKSKPKTGACYRCGRPGHYSPDCYARTHSDGYELDSDEDSDEY